MVIAKEAYNNESTEITKIKKELEGLDKEGLKDDILYNLSTYCKPMKVGRTIIIERDGSPDDVERVAETLKSTSQHASLLFKIFLLPNTIVITDK